MNFIRLTFLLLLGLAACSPEEETPCEGVDCIDATLARAEREGFSGTVLVAEGNKILLQKGYGMTALQGGEPITPDTVYLIGSIVKDFTRMGIFSLQERGLLSINDPISRFFPDAPADKRDITVVQLLDHVAGIPDLIDAEGNVMENYTVGYDYEHFTRDQMVEKTLKAPLVFEPGSDELYSNSGFALLGAIIEIASGQTYEEFINEVVFVPASMKKTGYRGPEWGKLSLAHGINDGVDWGTPLDGDRWMADGPSWNLRANGGMLGTVPDLFLFLRALATPGVYPEEVRQALIGDLTFSETYQSRYFAGAGSNGIFNSIFFFMVDQDRMIIMISSNSEHNAELDYIRDLIPFVFVGPQTD